MPVKSEKQMKFLQMIAHGGKSKKKHDAGPSPRVAKEMISKGKDYKKK